MKIRIQKKETFTITHSTKEFVFDMGDFKKCTPAFIGKNYTEFMDYITNDIEDINIFLSSNKDILSKETYKNLYNLEIDVDYTIEEDSREQYEDSWYTMESLKEGKDVTSIKKIV
jgi:hypothetical protein